MATTKTKTPKWRFPFLNHGLWRYRDEIRSAHWYLVFTNDVPDLERAATLEGRPPPSAGPVHWGGRMAVLESPPERFFDAHVWRAYGPKAGKLEEDEDEEEDYALTKPSAQAFIGAFDAWLDAVHTQRPIALVIASHGDPKDAWSKWSAAQVPASVVSSLHSLLASHAAPETEEQGSSALRGWAAWRALAAYFELHDAKSLDPTQRTDMAALAMEAKGHDPELDLKLDRMLRIIKSAS